MVHTTQRCWSRPYQLILHLFARHQAKVAAVAEEAIADEAEAGALVRRKTRREEDSG